MKAILFALILLSSFVVQAEPTGSELLSGMSSAYHKQNFQGRFVFVSGEKIHSLEILHGWQGGLEYERLRQLDGHGSQVIRRGDSIICQLADGEARLQRSAALEFVLPFSEKPINGNPHYDVVKLGRDRVADREAVQIELKATDTHRLSYRLWVDVETGLLLRSHTLDNQLTKKLESFEFVSLKILPEIQAEWFDPDPELSTHRIYPKAMREKSMAMSMFKSKWLPSGFLLNDIRHWEADAGRAETLMYSDGITAFTIFVEPVGKTVEIGGSAQSGATVAVDSIEDLGGESNWIVTVVGEIPMDTAKKILQNLASK